MTYFVYMVACEGGSIYTGITTDVERRFKEHRARIGGRYTRSHKVERILRTEKFESRSAALKREAEIKSWPKNKKMSLVNGND